MFCTTFGEKYARRYLRLFVCLFVFLMLFFFSVRFARFRVFLELISRFEFDVRRCGNFFERFEFLVCSKFNRTQCGRTWACVVACLRPQNSNSNVVVSVTIHDDTKMYIHFF